MTMVLELTEEQKERLQYYAAQVGKNPQSLLLEWVDTLPKTPDAQNRRIAGLGSGNILFLSPDFDAPLPDEFWLGDETNDPLHQ